VNLRDYYELFRYLMEQRCLRQEDILFVGSIAAWCGQQGIPETDSEKPFKLITREGQGCKMLIREEISEETIEERLNALSIRGQLLNAAADRADTLDSVQKKLAYLFLAEYARSIPDIVDDLLADNWAFREMERLGYFKT
jgi:hypothetical protein